MQIFIWKKYKNIVFLNSFSRHSLVAKHSLGKGETVSPILTDGSKDTCVSFGVRIGKLFVVYEGLISQMHRKGVLLL